MRRIAYAAMFIAFGILIPIVFHAVGMGGPIFLPMHIPVILGGLLIGPELGVAIGLITPLLSTLLTGMPLINPPILFLMMAELAVYGAVAGYLFRRFQSTLLAILGAMLAGRIALGLAVALAVQLVGFKASPVGYVIGAVVTGLPGIALQLFVVPSLAVILLQLPVGVWRGREES